MLCLLFGVMTIQFYDISKSFIVTVDVFLFDIISFGIPGFILGEGIRVGGKQLCTLYAYCIAQVFEMLDSTTLL